jgi:hypothetical protein
MLPLSAKQARWLKPFWPFWKTLRRLPSTAEASARKLIEIAHSGESAQDGRIFIEQINAPMLYQHKATPAENSAGLKHAIEKGWLELHESGTFVRFT